MSQASEPITDTNRSTRSTVIVMICTAASRLFGYVRQALLNYYFGGGAAAVNAMNAVFNIPNNLRKLFAEGAFLGIHPVLSTTLAEDRRKTLPRNGPHVGGIQLLVLVPLVALSLAFPRFFVITLLNFKDASTIATATTLMRWMFNYILLVSLSSLTMAVLNTHGKFALPG